MAFGRLKKLAEGVVAQLNPLDNGKTYDTVVNNQQVGYRQQAPQQVQQAVRGAKYGVLANNQGAQDNFLNNTYGKTETFADYAPKSFKDAGTATGLAGLRSLTGLAQGASGLADLASPGLGTSRFSKGLDNFAKFTDQTVKDQGLPQDVYKVGQFGTDALSFAAGGAVAKGIAKIPQVAKVANPALNVGNKISNPIISRLPQTAGGRIAGAGVKAFTNPVAQANAVGFTALTTGQDASKGRDISPQGVATNLAMNEGFNVGLPVAGRALAELPGATRSGLRFVRSQTAKPEAPQDLLNRQSDLLTARSALEVKNKPTGAIDPQIEALNQQIRQAQTRPILRPFTNEIGAVGKNVNDPQNTPIKPKEIKTRTIKTSDGKTEYVAQLGDTTTDRVGRATGFKPTDTSPNFKSEGEMNKWIDQNIEKQNLGAKSQPPKSTAKTLNKKPINRPPEAEEARIKMDNAFKEINDEAGKTGTVNAKKWREANKLADDYWKQREAIDAKTIPFQKDLQTPRRSQLSGKALDTPNAQLTGDPIADALGMNAETLASAKNPDVLAQVPSRKTPTKTTQANQGVDTPQGSSARDSELLSLGSRHSETSRPSNELSGTKLPLKSKQSKSSFDEIIPQIEEEIKGHPTYDISKKVSLLDKIRTPEKVLQKIGMGHIAKDLQKADVAYKLELPKRIDEISAWYDRVGRSQESSKRIFQYLDGQKGVTLNKTELQVAGEIKDYLSNFADRLGLPKDKRISNYITHIFDEKLLMKEFDPELEKLIADKVPGSVYDPFTQQRLGAKGYVEDAFRALDAYTKRGIRKVHMDPVLEKLANESQNLDKSGLDYVKQYGDRINMRPTDIDNAIDIMIKQTPVGYSLGQRPVAKISRTVRQATYRATLGMNVGSAVRNLTQGINTFAELGSRWTAKGYYDALKHIDGEELKKVGVLTDSFIEDRTISAIHKGMERMDKGLFFAFQGAERINRGAAYYGAKAQALNRGASLEEAVQAGIDAAKKTQFTFGSVNTPLALQSDIAKLFTQFQSYNVKQTEFVAHMVKEKEFAKLARYIGATGVVYYGMSRALGYKPEDMIPFGSNVTTGTSPIGGAPVFKIASGVKKTISAIKNPENPNAKTSKVDKVKKAAIGLGLSVGSTTVPGFVQAKKTVTGVNAVNKGEVRAGNKTYPVTQSPSNKAKGAIFGPYSLISKGGPTKSEAKKGSDPSPTDIANQALNNPKGEEFKKLTNDADRRQWAGLSQENFGIYKRWLAIKDATAPNKVRNPGLNDQEKKTLDRWDRLATTGKTKVTAEHPEQKKAYELARAKEQLLNNEIDQAQYDKKLTSINKTPKTKKVKVAKAKKASKGSKGKKGASIKIGDLGKGPRSNKVKIANSKAPSGSLRKPGVMRVGKAKTSRIGGGKIATKVV